MKILVDCVPLRVGGGLQVAVAFLVHLRQQSEIEWSAIASEQIKTVMPSDIIADPRIRFVQRRSSFDRLWMSRRLKAFEAEIDPDVVFTVFGPQHFYAKAPHVVGFALPNLIYDRREVMLRETVVDRAMNAMRRLMLRHANHLIVETATARDRLALCLGMAPDRISVIPNCVNPLLTRLADEPRPAARRSVILVPSAYYPHKNLEIVPSVAAAIRRQRPDFDFEFHLTLPANGANWPAIAASAAELGVADAVKTLGVVRLTDLATAYRDADAVFLPTLREVSTAVYPEAFFFHRPLVTTDFDFARELCADAALFVRPRDSEASAMALIEALTSEDVRSRLIEAGARQLAATYPTADEKFARQIKLLELISERRSDIGSRVSSKSSHDCPTFGRGQAMHETLPTTIARRVSDAIGFHDKFAKSWDAKYKSGGFRRRADFFFTNILPSIKSGGSWLDVGCGTGYFSRELSAKLINVVGVDGSLPMICEARRLSQTGTTRGSLSFDVVANVETLPYADSSFDGVLCLSVLEYLDRPLACLDEMARIVRPGGMFVLSIPHKYSAVRLVQRGIDILPDRIKPDQFDYLKLSKYSTTPMDIKNDLEARGLTSVRVWKFDPQVPELLLSLVPPSLMFVTAMKNAQL